MAQHQANPAHRAINLLSLEKRDIYLICLLMAGSGIMAFTIPLAVQTLVNVVTMGGVLQPLVVVSMMLFALLSLSGGLYVLEYYVVELILRRIFVRGAIQTAEHAQAMDMTVYDNKNTVELMNRFFDVATIQKASYQLLTKGLAAGLQAALGACVLMFYSFYFALISVILIVIAWFTISIIGRFAIQTAIKESYAKYDMAAWLESIAYNLNIFKFSTGRNIALQQTDHLVGQYLQCRKHHFYTLLKQNIVAVIIYALAGSIMLGVGGWLVMQGQINLGQFVAAELIIFSVLGSFLSFVSKLEYFYDLVAALDKLAYIQELPKLRESGQAMNLNTPPAIELKGASYDYSLRNISTQKVNLRVEAGADMAILADSGTDRAILAEMLVGLRNPTAGVVYIDDLDLRLIDLKELHSNMMFVNHLEILEGSILHNLTLGQAVDLSRVNQILDMLGLSERIADLPDGLDTVLLPRGFPMSRTELRLLMIARAALSAPHLLVIDAILDEIDDEALDAACNLLLADEYPWTLLVLTQLESVSSRFTQVYRLLSVEAK